MSEETPPGVPEDENEEGTEEETPGGTEEKPTAPPKDPELQRAIKARDRAKEELRVTKEELAGFKKKETEGEDPVAVANTRLVKAEARTQLAGIGVTDRDEQKAVIELLSLDDVTVDRNGEVDAEEIEARLATLRRIFAGKAARPKVPRTDTRDRGGKGDTTSDPDSARYKRILGK